MNPFYSIIIPVYNAEKYLDLCVESVLKQNSESSFEVILVNDGSRDGSAAICDRYAALDSRFRAIHQQNQGVSVARNRGIAEAKGMYLLFLDSDDIWDENLLKSADCFAEKQPDAIEFGYYNFSESGSREDFLPPCLAQGESGTEYFSRHESAGQMPIVSVCVKAFRRNFLIENELRFPVDTGYGEDFFFSMHCLKLVQSVYTVAQPLYGYRVNEESATHTPTPQKLHQLLSTCAQVYRLFPCPLLADYYCMRIWILAGLKRDEAAELRGILEENSDILQHIRGKKAHIARAFYQILGWYHGAKLLRVLVDFRNKAGT